MLQKYAIIDGNNVINSIEYESAPPTPPPGFDNTIIAVQSDVAAPGWKYIDGQFIPPPDPPPTPDQLKLNCKAIATGILSDTDWTTIPDVADPLKSNPYLMNQADFVAYRNVIRNYAINPVVDPVWPTKPTEQWSS